MILTLGFDVDDRTPADDQRGIHITDLESLGPFFDGIFEYGPLTAADRAGCFYPRVNLTIHRPTCRSLPGYRQVSNGRGGLHER